MVIVSGLVLVPADCQVEPPSVLYCQPVRGEPPSLPGATATVRARSSRITPVMVGWSGVVNGVPDTGLEGSPLPWELTARTDTAYVVPLASELIRKVLASVPVSVHE